MINEGMQTTIELAKHYQVFGSGPDGAKMFLGFKGWSVIANFKPADVISYTTIHSVRCACDGEAHVAMPRGLSKYKDITPNKFVCGRCGLSINRKDAVFQLMPEVDEVLYYFQIPYHAVEKDNLDILLGNYMHTKFREVETCCEVE
jgi:hypothetical protein